MPNKQQLWWQQGVIYHVYVRSFYDSNGDGIGDINGVIEKLDYIEKMGFSGIWLAPIFKSPMVDFGYDISDYREVDPEYGSLKDLKKLIREAHKRKIFVILDIALNHTSDQHPWFLESRSSRDNKKRDWYIWKEGRWFGPPNNWITGLYESVWEFDRDTSEYYLHSFLKNQPDLNWRNKAVKKEFANILKFWMNLGIDGFRLDMVNWLIKDKKFRDNPYVFPFKIFQNQIYNKNRKKIKSVLRTIRKTVEKFPGRMTVGEVFTMPPGDPELSAFFLGDGKNSLHMAFDFSLMYRYWNARLIFKAVTRWISAVPENAWPALVLSNHDQKRSFSRLCKGKHGQEKAKVLAALLLTLPGTPFVYYGEELGMKNHKFKKSEIRDPLGIRFWPFYKGRDGSRAPMKWSNRKHAGFTKADSAWLKVDPDYETCNVKSEFNNNDSLINFYKRLISLRNKEEVLHSTGGSAGWEIFENGKSGVVGYFRKSADNAMLVLLNFKKKIVLTRYSGEGRWRVVFSTHRPEKSIIPTDEHFRLDPFEVLILEKIET